MVIGAVMFAALVILMGSGCSSIPVRGEDVQEFTVYCAELDAVQDRWIAAGGDRDAKVRGFCDDRSRVIWVVWSGEYDRNGRPIPDLEVLGHEVWHLRELGGRWHGPVPYLIRRVSNPAP